MLAEKSDQIKSLSWKGQFYLNNLWDLISPKSTCSFLVFQTLNLFCNLIILIAYSVTILYDTLLSLYLIIFYCSFKPLMFSNTNKKTNTISLFIVTMVTFFCCWVQWQFRQHFLSFLVDLQVSNKTDHFVRSASKPTVDKKNSTFKNHVFSFAPSVLWLIIGKLKPSRTWFDSQVTKPIIILFLHNLF